MIKTDAPRSAYIDRAIRFVLEARTPVTVEQIASKLELSDLQCVLVRRWLVRYAERGLLICIPQGRSDYQAWLATEQFPTKQDAVKAASVWCAWIFLRKHFPEIDICEVPALIGKTGSEFRQETVS